MSRFRPSRRQVAALLAAAVALTLSLPVPAPAAAAAAGAAPPAVLEWKAAKEEGVYGYLVYRATDREGPYLRIGRTIVHVSTEPGDAHSYRFEDATVEAGRTYYYYLDKVANTGSKSRFSGVVTKSIPPG